MSKRFQFFVFLILIAASHVTANTTIPGIKAEPLVRQGKQNVSNVHDEEAQDTDTRSSGKYQCLTGYSRMFASLGLVCVCCDDKRGECRSSWEGPCSGKLQCSPWKHH